MDKQITPTLLAAAVVLLALDLVTRLGLVPTAVAQPAPVADVLRAKLIELVNAEGRVVGQLYTGEDGSGQLRLRDTQGEVRVKLGAAAEGSALLLMDERTEPAVWLTASRADTSVKLTQAGRESLVVTPEP